MATKYMIVSPEMGAPSPASQTATSAQWQLGHQMQGMDLQTGATQSGAGMFVYCVGSDASIGAWVAISGNTAVQVSTAQTASYFPIGVAAGALSATNVYGWVMVEGMCDFAKGTNASIAAGAPLYVGSAAGRCNSTAGATGYRIVGAAPTASYTSSQSDSLSVQLWYPYFVGKTANL